MNWTFVETIIVGMSLLVGAITQAVILSFWFGRKITEVNGSIELLEQKLIGNAALVESWQESFEAIMGDLKNSAVTILTYQQELMAGASVMKHKIEVIEREVTSLRQEKHNTNNVLQQHEMRLHKLEESTKS